VCDIAETPKTKVFLNLQDRFDPTISSTKAPDTGSACASDQAGDRKTTNHLSDRLLGLLPVEKQA
jgi:hypothetical protein